MSLDYFVTHVPGRPDQRPKTKGQRPKAKGQRPKAKGQRPKAKDQRPKTKDQRPKTKDQRQGPACIEYRHSISTWYIVRAGQTSRRKRCAGCEAPGCGSDR